MMNDADNFPHANRLVEPSCWDFANEVDQRYHDMEWGVPTHDDRHMFEHLCLECLQCGLSWIYVLQRRDLFRECFHNFEMEAVAAMDDTDIDRILEVPGILRNRAKLRAIVNNAQAALRLREEFGSFCEYFWNWTDGKTLIYLRHQSSGMPASNELSETIAKDLKRRGFKYVGAVNIYAHMQACGLICDHLENCPRFHYIRETYPTRIIPGCSLPIL